MRGCHVPCYEAVRALMWRLVEARSRVENHVSVFCCDLSA